MIVLIIILLILLLLCLGSIFCFYNNKTEKGGLLTSIDPNVYTYNSIYTNRNKKTASLQYDVTFFSDLFYYNALYRDLNNVPTLLEQYINETLKVIRQNADFKSYWDTLNSTVEIRHYLSVAFAEMVTVLYAYELPLDKVLVSDGTNMVASNFRVDVTFVGRGAFNLAVGIHISAFNVNYHYILKCSLFSRLIEFEEKSQNIKELLDHEKLKNINERVVYYTYTSEDLVRNLDPFNDDYTIFFTIPPVETTTHVLLNSNIPIDVQMNDVARSGRQFGKIHQIEHDFSPFPMSWIMTKQLQIIKYADMSADNLIKFMNLLFVKLPSLVIDDVNLVSWDIDDSNIGFDTEPPYNCYLVDIDLDPLDKFQLLSSQSIATKEGNLLRELKSVDVNENVSTAYCVYLIHVMCLCLVANGKCNADSNVIAFIKPYGSKSLSVADTRKVSIQVMTYVLMLAEIRAQTETKKKDESYSALVNYAKAHTPDDVAKLLSDKLKIILEKSTDNIKTITAVNTQIDEQSKLNTAVTKTKEAVTAFIKDWK